MRGGLKLLHRLIKSSAVDLTSLLAHAFIRSHRLSHIIPAAGVSFQTNSHLACAALCFQFFASASFCFLNPCCVLFHLHTLIRVFAAAGRPASHELICRCQPPPLLAAALVLHLLFSLLDFPVALRDPFQPRVLLSFTLFLGFCTAES